MSLIWKIIYYLVEEFVMAHCRFLELYFDIEIITDTIILKNKYNSASSIRYFLIHRAK